MMNDPLVKLEAERWANEVLSENDLSDERKIDRLFMQATATTPTKQQRRQLVQFLKDQSVGYGAQNGSVIQKAWVDLTHAILNLKAFTFLR